MRDVTIFRSLERSEQGTVGGKVPESGWDFDPDLTAEGYRVIEYHIEHVGHVGQEKNILRCYVDRDGTCVDLGWFQDIDPLDDVRRKSGHDLEVESLEESSVIRVHYTNDADCLGDAHGHLVLEGLADDHPVVVEGFGGSVATRVPVEAGWFNKVKAHWKIELDRVSYVERPLQRESEVKSRAETDIGVAYVVDSCSI